MSTQKFIVFRCGYAESCSISRLIFSRWFEKDASRKEVLCDFTEFLFCWYCWDQSVEESIKWYEIENRLKCPQAEDILRIFQYKMYYEIPLDVAEKIAQMFKEGWKPVQELESHENLKKRMKLWRDYTPPTFDFEDFEYWISDKHGRDNDCAGHAEEAAEDSGYWNWYDFSWKELVSANGSDVIVIEKNAQCLFSNILTVLHPELEKVIRKSPFVNRNFDWKIPEDRYPFVEDGKDWEL